MKQEELISLFSPDLFIPNLKAKNRDDALQEMVEHASDAGVIRDQDVILGMLKNRESLGSTGLGEGVAFPHGRVPMLDRLLACFGRCGQGVDFDSFDSRPTFFFFVLLIPEHAQGSHLKALARLNRLFQDQAFRERLLAAQNADRIFDIIMEQDERC